MYHKIFRIAPFKNGEVLAELMVDFKDTNLIFYADSNKYPAIVTYPDNSGISNPTMFSTTKFPYANASNKMNLIWDDFFSDYNLFKFLDKQHAKFDIYAYLGFYEKGIFRDKQHDIYQINIETWYETKVATPNKVSGKYEDSVIENYVCESTDTKKWETSTLSNCYAPKKYAVLNRVFLDGTTVKREVVAKIDVPESTTELIGAKWHESITYLPAQYYIDSDYFYKFDMINKTATKTSWQLGSTINNIKAKSDYLFSSSGVSWRAAEYKDIFYIPFEQNALPKRITTHYLAGGMNMIDSTLYFTEMLSEIQFETYRYRVKTDEKTLLSTDTMDSGSIGDIYPTR